MAIPEQAICVAGAPATVGFGFTETTIVKVLPGQLGVEAVTL